MIRGDGRSQLVQGDIGAVDAERVQPLPQQAGTRVQAVLELLAEQVERVRGGRVRELGQAALAVRRLARAGVDLDEDPDHGFREPSRQRPVSVEQLVAGLAGRPVHRLGQRLAHVALLLVGGQVVDALGDLDGEVQRRVVQRLIRRDHADERIGRAAARLPVFS